MIWYDDSKRYDSNFTVIVNKLREETVLLQTKSTI
jgi:hypothetical protein